MIDNFIALIIIHDSIYLLGCENMHSIIYQVLVLILLYLEILKKLVSLYKLLKE